MITHARIPVVAAFLAALPATADAALMTVGPGGFDNGFATTITYDDAAARGTTNDRDDPTNALGANNGDFFEIGFGSYIDLTFGTIFDGSTTVFEVTFGNAAAFPESADILAGFGGVYTLIVGDLSNAAAQGGAIISLAGFGGPFDTIRISDTSSPINGATTGGFDIDAVRVAPVPLPAAFSLLAGALGLIGFFGRRRKQASA
jgi:hypothetical protein